jgi:hypothetical protein
MKKKYSKKQLKRIEKEMTQGKLWAVADHTVVYKGPLSIQFSNELLRKLHAISHVRKKSIQKLVNEYVKPFVDGEYSVLEHLK